MTENLWNWTYEEIPPPLLTFEDVPEFGRDFDIPHSGDPSLDIPEKIETRRFSLPDW